MARGDTSGQAGGSEPMAIIRYANGQVDDVAISGDLFRMEQMDKDCWWVAVYRGKDCTMFDLRWDRKTHNIVATVYQDEIGCIDDCKQVEEAAKCQD